MQAVLARPGQDEAVAILFVKHDNSYKTVAFGETVIKEMFFVSTVSKMGDFLNQSALPTQQIS